MNPLMPFVFTDWLTIVEYGVFPQFKVGQIMKLTADGEVEWLTPENYQLQGSFDSSAILRVYADRRVISFNPARWNRPDNLWGPAWTRALQIADEMLATAGQPPLGKSERQRDPITGRVTYTGPTLQRIDLTSNLATTNKAGLERFIRGAKFTRIGRSLPTIETHGVRWGKSSWRKLTVYDKGTETKAHTDKNDPNADHRKMIADYCDAFGLARVEVRLGKKYIHKHGIGPLCNIDQEKIEHIYMKETTELFGTTEAENIENLTHRARGMLAMWQRGQNPRDGISTATFYRYRKEIRLKTGYDIGLKIFALEPKTEKLAVYWAHPPSWYELPKATKLTLVNNGD